MAGGRAIAAASGSPTDGALPTARGATFSRADVGIRVDAAFDRLNRVRIGVNNAHIGEYEEDGDPTYGGIDAIFGSLAACSANFVRQPGRYDLIVPPDPTNASGQAALPLADDLETWVSDTFEDWITALLTNARSYGIRVVLTFFSLGGGGATYDYADPDYDYVTNSAVRMDWSLHPAGTEITNLLRGSATYAFGDEASGATGDPVWDEATYDARDAYKLVYTQHLAYWMGRMLARVARANGFANAATFDGYLAGIELFNEVNTVNRFEDGSVEGPAELWAEAVAFAVEGFRLAKDEDGLPEDFPLWWPSLASENADQPFTSYIQPFHQALVAAAKARIERGGAISASILVNQDTHWYRFTERQGARPAVEMVDIVAGLQDDFAAVGLGPSVSICETGATMSQSTTRAAYPAYVDSAGVGDTSEAARRFQAREVVRRIGVGACTGATRVAWHSHMGQTNDSEGFAGTGLRQDGSSVISAALAVTRLSWWTFRRWRQLLRGREGTIKQPAGGEPYAGLDTGDPEAVFTVLRFEGTRRLPYAWVMFVDSAATDLSEVHVDVILPIGTRVAEVALVPDSLITGTDRIPEETFQDDEATFPARVHMVATDDYVPLTFALDGDPVLWFTDADLVFTVTA